VGDHALSQAVMQLEQRMTTGGGWQDQAGGIFPGAKLLITGPGLRQRIRVQPVTWTEARRAEFCQHMVLYNTGIQRVAKDLLRQVVSRYLARETATIQVLHSIKTLAVEMSYAMAEGDWKHLGELLDRHWQLNQVLDPHTANAPINAILERARPFIYGAKLAGAGGGGFLMLLARTKEAAGALRAALSHEAGAVVPYRIAEEGLRVQTHGD
jgi:fucokinase